MQTGQTGCGPLHSESTTRWVPVFVFFFTPPSYFTRTGSGSGFFFFLSRSQRGSVSNYVRLGRHSWPVFMWAVSGSFPAWARVHVVMYPTSPQGWGRAVHWHGTALLIGGFSAAKGRCFCCWWCWCWPPAAARPCSPAAARRQRREAPVTPPVIDRKTQHIWSPSTPTLTWGFYAVKSSPLRTHTRTRPPPHSPSSCIPPADGIYKDSNTISVIEALGARKCVSELQTPICLDDKPEMKWQSNMFSNPRLSFFKNIKSVSI